LRFSVYLKTSEVLPEKADHECSRQLAVKAVLGRYARKVGQNAIQLLHDNTWQWVKQALRGEAPRPAKLYIPEKLPPREVPGCYFEEPKSDTWRLQHRNVAFLAQLQENVVSS